MSLRDETRFQRAGLGIKPGVQDAAVALAHAVADIEILLDDADAQLVTRVHARKRTADQPRADDQKIKGFVHGEWISPS